MRIAIVGGGPGGLYAALLLRRRRPDWDVAVHERYAPDATFGWGVVFSGPTLARLAAEDAASHAAIEASAERWSQVDVVHRGTRISVEGNAFGGVARIAMLHALQDRCRALGVALHFQSPIEDPAALAGEVDLVVGADGAGSTVRRAFADHLRPTLDPRNNRYIWLGTTQRFEALTMIFHETPHGVFIGHAYPFRREMGTLVVECDERTWERAGFEGQDEASMLRALAEVFAPELGGHPLVANGARWIRFVMVRNGRWYHENVVLLGDALHTAHFSIGSGTKLALEDAIALADCLERSGGDVGAALPAFEAERRPAVEEYQAASQASLEWLEAIGPDLALEPVPFAYRLMTRSGRIDREKLRRRSPAFVARVEAWEAVHAGP